MLKFLVSVTLTLLWSIPLLAEGSGEKVGFNGLYMGHSFFIPSVKQLEQIVEDSEITNHQQTAVFAGGAYGSPRRLWDNEKKRTEIENYLNTKKYDLVAMTYFSPVDSSLEHYSRWIDYAISKNPTTTFMITLPWSPQLFKASVLEITIAKVFSVGLKDSLIKDLRDKYPNNKILFCPYGLGTYELVERFRKGQLPGVKHVLNENRLERQLPKSKYEQLLRDELGHPNELVSKLGALLWLQTLYDYDLEKMKPQMVTGLPKINLNEIALFVGKQIRPLNDVYDQDADE